MEIPGMPGIPSGKKLWAAGCAILALLALLAWFVLVTLASCSYVYKTMF